MPVYYFISPSRRQRRARRHYTIAENKNKIKESVRFFASERILLKSVELIMSSLPPSTNTSMDKPESMKELAEEKFFPLGETCPLRIKIDHFPAIDETSRKSFGRRLSPQFETDDFTLPEIGCDFEPCGRQDWENLIVPDGPFKFVTPGVGETSSIAGPSLCQPKFECKTRQMSHVSMRGPEEKLEESHALKRWDYWMKDKRKMQEYLSKRLQRSTWRLLLQESDKIRKDLEEKWLRTYTQIPEADKWRGHPFRWKAQLRLYNRNLVLHNRKSYTPPQYCAVKTGLDNGEIPEMEFIGLPKTIQKEKGVIYKRNVVEVPLIHLAPEEAKYIKKRRKKLKPHQIKMDDLEVIGRKIFKDEEILQGDIPKVALPTITVTETDDFDFATLEEKSENVFCLVIGEDVITYNLEDAPQIPSETYAWQVNFGVNTINTIVRSVLRVENRGTLTIRYSWARKLPERFCSILKLQEKEYEPCFFFNKNSGCFLPGQIYNLEFYHSAKSSGIRKEVWCLKTTPPLSQNREECTVTLSAIATQDLFFTSLTHHLENYINRRVKDTIVKCMIEIILRKVFSPTVRGIEYRSIFSKKLLFECYNPNYYYNSMIVKELQKIFYEVTHKSRGEWDLSLNTLVRLVTTVKTGKEKNAVLSQIFEKAKLLLKPTYVTVRGDRKYRMAYGILRNFIAYMEEDCDLFTSLYSQNLTRRSRHTDESQDENMGEFDYHTVVFPAMKPKNLMFIKTLLYVKVYYRLGQAIDDIAGVLETEQLFESWNQLNYLEAKPRRRDEDYPETPPKNINE